jgi:N-acetylmuramoyl-L-alanine amidase
MTNHRVYIDPGHGGLDNGASYGYVDEDETNLNIGYLLDYEFKASGIITFMTREKDEYVSLQQRSLLANIKQVDAFISIHCDAWHSETSSGMTVHISPKASTGAETLAKAIVVQLSIQFPGHKQRGIKKSNFHVLNATKMPAVLVECEFLSNPDTRKFLKKPENQKRLAQTIHRGALNYFNNI